MTGSGRTERAAPGRRAVAGPRGTLGSAGAPGQRGAPAPAWNSAWKVAGIIALVALVALALAAFLFGGAWPLTGVAAAQEPDGSRSDAGGVRGAPPTGLLEEPAVGPDEATHVFREANALYEEESYGPAAALYEAILAGGFENAEVHYNLANARYKSGDIGRAVLGYERALGLDPSHEDALANLEFVREQLADRQIPVGGALSTALDRFFRRAQTGRLAFLASVFYFVLAGLVVTGVLRGAFQPWVVRGAVVTAALLVVAAGTLGYRLHRERTVREAVVVVADVPVRTGPGDDFVLEFRLHEGTKVRLREGRGDWLRVSLEGTDLEGWLPDPSVEEI